MEIKTRPDIGRDLVSGDNVVIDTGSAFVTASPDRFATFAAGAAQTTQTVTSSPATVSARFIVLDDDSHTSGSPGTLRMPPITEGAWHVIATPYEDVHFEVLQDAGDPANTGPDYQIDSSFVRHQTTVFVAVESEGQLRWQYDETALCLTQLYLSFFALVAYGAGAQVISSTSDEINDAQDVFVTNASAAVAVLLPDAAGGRRVRLHKANNAATQTITLVRSAADTSGGGAINGSVASYNIVFSDGDGPYRSWDVAAPTALAWHVSDGVDKSLIEVWNEIANINGTELPALVAADAALDTRIDALEVTGRQVITTATATILPGTRVVYIDHAAARTDLTLPATPFEPFTIVKRATSGGFGVRLIPNAGTVAIQGLAAGTNFDIGWTTTNASTTTARPAAFVSSSVASVVDVA